jgi:hypothetical protein
MFRFFDFSSPIDRTTDQVVVGAGMFLFLTGLCAYLLYYRDQEAQRLVDLAKLWGKRVEDETKELQRTKMRIVVGYSIGLGLNMLLTARFCFELLRRF